MTGLLIIFIKFFTIKSISSFRKIINYINKIINTISTPVLIQIYYTKGSLVQVWAKYNPEWKENMFLTSIDTSYKLHWFWAQVVLRSNLRYPLTANLQTWTIKRFLCPAVKWILYCPSISANIFRCTNDYKHYHFLT